MKKLKSLVIAGTFDHLHQGHKQFITEGFNHAEAVYCGLTTNWVNKNKAFPLSLQSFSKRFITLKKFIKTQRAWQKATIFPLNNPFGLSLENNNLEGICVTPDTFNKALIVNKKRQLAGLKALSILKLSLIMAQDSKKISSTRIRAGLIDRQGTVYSHLFPQKTLYLPMSSRPYFQKPIGKLLVGSKSELSWAGLQALKNIKQANYPLVITVGDIVTLALKRLNLTINLAVFDQRSQRKPLLANFHSQLKKNCAFHYQAKNQPGTIAQQSVDLIRKSLEQIINLNQTGIIQIHGEEDLLVLALILLSPLKTLIFYGQPNRGLVQVEVTEKIKKKALQLCQILTS